MELTLHKLNKIYGNNHALKDFSYTFSDGVYGLLGPNGAGKTTLMNMITDNLKSSSGDIMYDGVGINKLGKEYRRILGYMPQQQVLYHNFTLLRYMYYMAALKGISKHEATKQIDRLIKIVNLDEVKYRRLGTFSGGMKQRALIAQALLGNPKVIILDEPTAGLDPKERIRIRNIISEVAFNVIVIIATHVVSDIEFIAKEVLLLKKGSIIASGSPSSLNSYIADKVYEIKSTQDKLREISNAYKIGNISKDEEQIVIRVVSDNTPIMYRYQAVKPTLEDLYLYYFDEGMAYADN